ncbi:MAG: hypothetical protein U0610_14575 [bacterium]
MRSHALASATLVALLLASRCGGESGGDARECRADGGASALSTCLVATQAPDHYIEQSSIYFDTLDSSVSPFVQPDYSELVARWEWPPWLLLTGFTEKNMIVTDVLLKLFPTDIAARDCRFFPEQPFGRCRVVFDYSGLPCPIYEEFTFNDAGEMTFIEAWTDAPGWLPTDDPSDPWAEGARVHRLSTKVPGLGNASGRIDLDAPWMEAAASADADVAEFLRRARDPLRSWLAATLAAPPDFTEQGCAPPGPPSSAARLRPDGRSSAGVDHAR